MKLSIIFEEKPKRWGFRGDPYFWDHLKGLAEDMGAVSPDELEEWIKNEYLTLSGKPLTDEYNDFAVIKQFAHGGMSSGGVDNTWWMEEGIPLLKSRLTKANEKMVRLESVTPENWRLGLGVSEDQRSFVSDSARILARAYAYRESRSRAFVIYVDDLPVGMALYYDNDEDGAYVLSQFFIDQRYQRNGFGYEASKTLLQMMRDDGKYGRVVLCYVEDDEAARKLYEKLGFRHTGESDEDEIMMELDLG